MLEAGKMHQKFRTFLERLPYPLIATLQNKWSDVPGKVSTSVPTAPVFVLPMPVSDNAASFPQPTGPHWPEQIGVSHKEPLQEAVTKDVDPCVSLTKKKKNICSMSTVKATASFLKQISTPSSVLFRSVPVTNTSLSSISSYWAIVLNTTQICLDFSRGGGKYAKLNSV